MKIRHFIKVRELMRTPMTKEIMLSRVAQGRKKNEKKSIIKISHNIRMALQSVIS